MAKHSAHMLIWVARVNNEMTLKAVGEMYGVTQERVRQICAHKDRDLNKLRTRDFYSPPNPLPKYTECPEIPMSRFDTSVRTYFCLLNENLMMLSDVLALTNVDLLRLPNFGRKSLNELHELFKFVGVAHLQKHGPQKET